VIKIRDIQVHLSKFILSYLFLVLPIDSFADVASDLNKQFKVEKWLQAIGNPYWKDAGRASKVIYTRNGVIVQSINKVPLFQPFNDARLSIEIYRNGESYSAKITTSDGYLTCRKDICNIPMYISFIEDPITIRGYISREENSILIPDMGMIFDSSLKMGEFFSLRVQFFGRDEKFFNFRALDYTPL